MVTAENGNVLTLPSNLIENLMKNFDPIVCVIDINKLSKFAFGKVPKMGGHLYQIKCLAFILQMPEEVIPNAV